MRFHWTNDKGEITGTGELPLGKSLKIVGSNPDRPNYVTIESKEIKESTMTEKQMVQYFSQIKKLLYFGGKVYLEIDNYA